MNAFKQHTALLVACKGLILGPFYTLGNPSGIFTGEPGTRSDCTFSILFMKDFPTEKRSVTPEKAVKILSQNGCKIDEKEAEKLLDLMYFLAKSIVNQNFKI